jgi:FtsH-binding integral membrane protein
MEQSNPQNNPFSSLHKQKLYALIAAAVGFIAVFLPWWSFGFFGSISGLHDLGVLVFLAFIGAGVLCFLGDKTKPFDGQFKLITAACFAGAALFTLIQFIRISTGASYGIFLSLIAGIGGAVIVYFLKPEQFENKKPPM